MSQRRVLLVSKEEYVFHSDISLIVCNSTHSDGDGTQKPVQAGFYSAGGDPISGEGASHQVPCDSLKSYCSDGRKFPISEFQATTSCKISDLFSKCQGATTCKDSGKHTLCNGEELITRLYFCIVCFYFCMN